MSVHTLVPRRLTAHDFAGFGSVVAYPVAPEEAPLTGEPTERGAGFDWFERLLVERYGTDLSFGMIRSYPGVVTRSELQRHLKTPTLLIPLNAEVVLIVGRCGSVARPWTDRHLSGAEAPLNTGAFTSFLIPQGQLVVIGPGVWHTAPVSIAGTARTLIGFAANTERDDSDTIDLSRVDLQFRVEAETIL